MSDTFVKLVGDVGGATIGQTIGDGILRGAEFLATIADGFIVGALEMWNQGASVGAEWATVWDYAQRTASFLAGVADVLQVGIAATVLGATGTIQAIMTAFQEVARMLGFQSATLDAAMAGLGAFNETLANGMTDNMASASANFGKAFADEQQRATSAAAGPLGSALRDAIAKAKADAAAPSVPKTQTLADKDKKTFTGTSASELKATDSRSKEGIAEMFRLMRGEKDDIPEKSLDMLTQIHLDLAGADDGMLVEIGAN